MNHDQSATPNLNLMPADELENRPGGKFLRWALGWGKKIVILTEFVVILAFLSRFWLDTTVADQVEKINLKRGIVQASLDLETKFRLATKRLDQAKGIETKVSQIKVFDLSKEMIPAELVVNQISVTNGVVSFAGSGPESTVGKLVETYKTSKYFDNVSVERVTSKNTVSGVEFALRADYVVNLKDNQNGNSSN